MQWCPLAGSDCGLMVWAKPWEASEVARQSLLGHGPTFVGLAPASDPVTPTGRPESEWRRLVLGVLIQQISPSAIQAENVISFIFLFFLISS